MVLCVLYHPFNQNLVQPQSSLSVTYFQPFSKIRAICALSIFLSFPTNPFHNSRLHESHPSHISNFFSLKGKRQGLMEREKEAGQPYMQLLLLFTVASAGHYSFLHRQPWINIWGLCFLSKSSFYMPGGKHERMKSRKSSVLSWKPEILSLSTPQVASDRWS